TFVPVDAFVENGLGPMEKTRRGAVHHALISIPIGHWPLFYTSSRSGALSTRCCGRPVGSVMVVVDGSMPRLWYRVAKPSPKVTGRRAGNSPSRLVAPMA